MKVLKSTALILAIIIMAFVVTCIIVFSSRSHSATRATHGIPDYSKELKWGCVGSEC
jgi:hypothetical protein